MKIHLQPNHGPQAESRPYTAVVEIVTLTVNAGNTFQLPIRRERVGAATRYTAAICGFNVQADTPDDIVTRLARFIPTLVNRARLPNYIFIARRHGSLYPVYTVDNEVLATTPGGPVFRHVELARVRAFLTDYLHETGILGDAAGDDKLHVRGVDPHTLGLRRPVFYLKKRVPGEDDFWAPVFISGDGRRIYTHAASARREVAIDEGREVLMLRTVVAHALQADGRLNDLDDLRPDRLQPAYWARLQSRAINAGRRTIGAHDIALFRADSVLFGLEERPAENRVGLFPGQSEDDIVVRVARDFRRRGLSLARRPLS